MSVLGTGHTPQAGTTAEAEALIAEARARARRRRRRIAVAVVGAVAVAAGGLAAAGGFNGSRPAATGQGRTADASAQPSGPPAYFLDATDDDGGYSSPEIRASATGTVVAPIPIGNVPALRGYDPPYGLAATGPRSFVVGLMTPSDCSTQFFRFQLNNHGRPGALTPVGPTLPGDLSSIAASAGGGLIAYEIDGDGCANARTLGSYLGVLDVSTGRTRQWTGVPRYSGQLSMSADGRLIAFSQEDTKPGADGGYQITGYQVRTLATDAAPGTVAARSRVAARISPEDSFFTPPTVLLSPAGTSFYLCSQPFSFAKPGTKRITETAKILAYRTATGKPTGVVAAWAASYAPNSNGGSAPMTLSCSSMTLDPSGRYLLVPYRQTFLHPADEYSGGSLTAARISIATGARSDWTLRYGERESPGAMSIAW
jgi:hypothetical protein